MDTVIKRCKPDLKYYTLTQIIAILTKLITYETKHVIHFSDKSSGVLLKYDDSWLYWLIPKDALAKLTYMKRGKSPIDPETFDASVADPYLKQRAEMVLARLMDETVGCDIAYLTWIPQMVLEEHIKRGGGLRDWMDLGIVDSTEKFQFCLLKWMCGRSNETYSYAKPPKTVLLGTTFDKGLLADISETLIVFDLCDETREQLMLGVDSGYDVEMGGSAVFSSYNMSSRLVSKLMLSAPYINVEDESMYHPVHTGMRNVDGEIYVGDLLFDEWMEGDGKNVEANVPKRLQELAIYSGGHCVQNLFGEHTKVFKSLLELKLGMATQLSITFRNIELLKADRHSGPRIDETITLTNKTIKACWNDAEFRDLFNCGKAVYLGLTLSISAMDYSRLLALGKVYKNKQVYSSFEIDLRFPTEEDISYGVDRLMTYDRFPILHAVKPLMTLDAGIVSDDSPSSKRLLPFNVRISRSDDFPPFKFSVIRTKFESITLRFKHVGELFMSSAFTLRKDYSWYEYVASGSMLDNGGVSSIVRGCSNYYRMKEGLGSLGKMYIGSQYYSSWKYVNVEECLEEMELKRRDPYEVYKHHSANDAFSKNTDPIFDLQGDLVRKFKHEHDLMHTNIPLITKDEILKGEDALVEYLKHLYYYPSLFEFLVNDADLGEALERRYMKDGKTKYGVYNLLDPYLHKFVASLSVLKYPNRSSFKMLSTYLRMTIVRILQIYLLTERTVSQACDEALTMIIDNLGSIRSPENAVLKLLSAKVRSSGLDGIPPNMSKNVFDLRETDLSSVVLCDIDSSTMVGRVLNDQMQRMAQGGIVDLVPSESRPVVLWCDIPPILLHDNAKYKDIGSIEQLMKEELDDVMAKHKLSFEEVMCFCYILGGPSFMKMFYNTCDYSTLSIASLTVSCDEYVVEKISTKVMTLVGYKKGMEINAITAHMDAAMNVVDETIGTFYGVVGSPDCGQTPRISGVKMQHGMTRQLVMTQNLTSISMASDISPAYGCERMAILCSDSRSGLGSLPPPWAALPVYGNRVLTDHGNAYDPLCFDYEFKDYISKMQSKIAPDDEMRVVLPFSSTISYETKELDVLKRVLDVIGGYVVTPSVYMYSNLLDIIYGVRGRSSINRIATRLSHPTLQYASGATNSVLHSLVPSSHPTYHHEDEMSSIGVLQFYNLCSKVILLDFVGQLLLLHKGDLNVIEIGARDVECGLVNLWVGVSYYAVDMNVYSDEDLVREYTFDFTSEDCFLDIINFLSLDDDAPTLFVMHNVFNSAITTDASGGDLLTFVHIMANYKRLHKRSHFSFVTNHVSKSLGLMGSNEVVLKTYGFDFVGFEIGFRLPGSYDVLHQNFVSIVDLIENENDSKAWVTNGTTFTDNNGKVWTFKEAIMMFSYKKVDVPVTTIATKLFGVAYPKNFSSFLNIAGNFVSYLSC